MKSNSEHGAPHQSEKIFRRYERYIELLLQTYPEPMLCQNEQFSPTTFAAQFRSAISGVLLHRYSTNVNLETLAEVWEQVKVVIRGDIVYVLPKQSTVEAVKPTDPANSCLLTLNNPTVDQLNALASLYRTGVTDKPTRLTGSIPSWSPGDIIVAPQPDGSHLIL